MMGLNAWQTMLWIIFLVALLAPIILILVNSIFISFYKAKAAFFSKILKALSATIEQATKLKAGNKDGV